MRTLPRHRLSMSAGSLRRLLVLGTTLDAIVAFAVGGGAVTGSAGSEWPQFRGGPAHTGTNAGEHALSRDNVGRLRLAWAVHAGVELRSPPVVARGVIFTATVGGGASPSVEARGVASAIRRWRRPLRGEAIFSLAVSGDRLYGIDWLGGVFALDAGDGRRIWREEYTDVQGDAGPVVVDGARVFTGAQALSAHDAETGRRLWWKPGAEECSSCSPAVSGNVLYFGVRRVLFALDARTGRKHWLHRLPLGTYWGRYPALGETLVFAPAVKVHDPPAETEPVALYALARRSGALVWKAQLGRWDEVPAGAAAVAGGVIYVASRDGALYAFRTRSGTRLWRAPLDGPTSSSPAVANGVVYVGGREHLFALDAQTGKTLWSAELSADGGPLSPVVADGAVFVSSRDGALYRFDLPPAQNR